MDMSPESVIITEVPKGFRDMDMEDTIKELLNLDITTDMVIHMFIKTETIIMVHMDMKLIMTTKNGLQNQDMDMEVTAMCTEQQKV